MHVSDSKRKMEGMRMKSYLKIMAVTGLLAALGGGGLYGAMVFAQKKEVEKNIETPDQIVDVESSFTVDAGSENQNKTETSSEQAKDISDSEHKITKSDVEGVKIITDDYEWNGFDISFIVYEGITQEREAQDMKPEEALKIALHKIEEMYKTNPRGCAVEIDLKNNQSGDNLNSRNANVRNYTATVFCSDTLLYSFSINSITGEIIFLGKYCSEENENHEYDMNNPEVVAELEKEYYKIASDFINQSLDYGKVKNVSGLMSGCVQSRFSMNMKCETSNGNTIVIEIDQETKEILYYAVDPFYKLDNPIA